MLTRRQESFCLAYVETGNASEAYRRSYTASNMKPNVINIKACQTLALGKIKARIEELRQPAAEAAQMTLASHLMRLEILSSAAEKARQFSAAITAEIARGKAAGIHIEKSEQFVTTKELPASVDDFV